MPKLPADLAIAATPAEPQHTRGRLIGIDWGTTALRAYLFDAHGEVIDSAQSRAGVQLIADRQFRQAMVDCCGAWFAQNRQLPVLASGMIGSAQGWREAPYVACPASLQTLSEHLTVIHEPDAAPVYVVPGLKQLAQAPVQADAAQPDVMRGEETQILGADSRAHARVYVLPGSHSKWVRCEHDQVLGFRSFMTGELYAAIAEHTIVGRLFAQSQSQAGEPIGSPTEFDRDALADGVNCIIRAPESLTAHLFSVRAQGLLGLRAHEALPSYLSGLLIGAEIAGGKAWARGVSQVSLVGSAALSARYQFALQLVGIQSTVIDSLAAARGLVRIAKQARLLAG